MPSPYVSSRTGRFQWMMQRASAALLLPLAFVHFGMQHFTSEAVSTGLATTWRLHDPFWVTYYVIFVTLVLYHGVNGVLGIVSDYAPKPLSRNVIALVLWTLALFFGVLGIRNLVAPGHNVESAKNWYVLNGFPEGEAAGNPPNFLWTPKYDFNDELRELHLLNHYLSIHTTRTEEEVLESAAIFAAAENGKDAAAGGAAFDAWALSVVVNGDAHLAARVRNHLFSSSYEFAVWALNVRKTNARKRINDEDSAVVTAANATLERLASIPAFTPDLH